MAERFSFSAYLSALIFGVFGVWIFRQGFKQVRYALMAIGAALVLAPYITQGALADWGVGLGLCFLAYWIW